MQIGSDLKKRLHRCLIGCTYVPALICVRVCVCACVCGVRVVCVRAVCVWCALGARAVHARCVRACSVHARCACTVCACKFILPAHTMSEYFYIIFGDKYYESIITRFDALNS